MAISIGTHTIANSDGNVSGLNISKPVNVAQYDLMVAFVTRQSGAISSVPSGWTLIESLTENNSVYLYYKIAGDSEPSSYTWTFSSASIERIRIAIIPFKGNKAKNPISAVSKNSSVTNNFSLPSIPQPIADSIILLLGVSVPERSFSGYSIANDPPTFNEIYDSSLNPNSTICAAYGIRPPTDDTGNGLIVLSGFEAGVDGFMLSIPPGINEKIDINSGKLKIFGKTIQAIKGRVMNIIFGKLKTKGSHLDYTLVRKWKNKLKPIATVWKNKDK